MFGEDLKKDLLTRLAKIEGQVRGIAKMIESDKYCIDIINQVSAVRGALDKVALKILKKHVNTCVVNAIKSDKSEEIIEELIKTIDRYLK
ncbi:metal-sensitive transcriptional regulator [Deferribacter autotrophicus]|uniref:Metal-sensitive transcriptional regulator n=1 Tax=Deferribacter autotrophicus TaxID=500465 RepID=A0A5A8F3D9_9BACT|nr:metal-sensitive transcriptional regulator [Deferribacter autotrophicus]KAA0258368.1 metal-sensitive transcriptional regulator [Deferribacter autotrophicus]